MLKWMAPLALLALAACASPLERCISDAGAGVVQLETELAERRLAVARGFRLEDRIEGRIATLPCPAIGATAQGLCTGVVENLVQRRVPINPVIEQERIIALEGILAREQARAQVAVASCRASFPGGRS